MAQAHEMPSNSCISQILGSAKRKSTVGPSIWTLVIRLIPRTRYFNWKLWSYVRSGNDGSAQSHNGACGPHSYVNGRVSWSFNSYETDLDAGQAQRTELIYL